MANSSPFDGTNFLPDAPDQEQPHGNDFREHQSTRKSMELVNNKEHEAIGTNPSLANGGGVHSNGASVSYEGTTTPINRPDGVTALADNAVDRGRTWYDGNFTPPLLKKWDGSAWATVADDGDSPTLNDSESNAMAKLHAYLTQTSGFVTAYSPISSTDNLVGYVGDTDDPVGAGLQVASTRQSIGSAAIPFISFFVGKGKYFEITHEPSATRITWTPLVTGGGNPIDQD